MTCFRAHKQISPFATSGDKHNLTYVRVLVILVLAIISTHGVLAANPGHGAASIGAGTFESGDYVFPNDLNINGDLYVGDHTSGMQNGTLYMGRTTSDGDEYLKFDTAEGTNGKFVFSAPILVPGASPAITFYDQNQPTNTSRYEHLVYDATDADIVLGDAFRASFSAGDGSPPSGKTFFTVGPRNLSGAAGPGTYFGYNTPGSFTGDLMHLQVGDTTRFRMTQFGDLIVRSGIMTGNGPILNIEQTWNNAGATFTAFDMNIVNTGSAAASQLANWKVDGTSKFIVYRNGSADLSAELRTPQICLNGDCQTSWPSGAAASGWTDQGTQVQLITATDNVSANTLFVDNTNGRVGVGTNTPANTVSINGTLNITNSSGTVGFYVDENSQVGIGTDSPTNALHVVNDRNAAAVFFVEQANSLTGQKDVFVIQDKDNGGGSQDESSSFKVLKSGAINDADDGSSLVELTYSNANNDQDNKHFYVAGRTSDEGAINWGVDLYDADVWTTGSVKGGATGIDCGASNSECFNSPSFWLNASGDSYITGGNVGIGTNNPGYQLDVKGNVQFEDSSAATTSPLTLDNNNASATQTRLSWNIRNTNNWLQYLDYATGQLRFYNGTANVLNLDRSSGNVGIGTVSPGYALEVVGGEIRANNGSNEAIFGTNTEAGNDYLKIVSSTDDSFETILNGVSQFIVSTNGGGKVYVPNLNVGIGATTPTAKLHVQTADAAGADTPNAAADELLVEGSGNSGMTIFSGSSNTGNIYFGDADGAPRIGRIVFDHSDNSLGLYTSNIEAIHITNGQKVGIGTTAPNNTLTVIGDGNFTGNLYSNGAQVLTTFSESDPYWVANYTARTGSGSVVYSTSPVLTTPNIGAATGTSLTLSGNLQLNKNGNNESVLYFPAVVNDPGYIIHREDANQGRIYLIPSDDNSGNDYVAITNTTYDRATLNGENIRLYTSGAATFAGLITGTAGLTITGTVTLPAGSIDETYIAQDSLDDSEIQDDSLTALSLAPNSVGASEIAANAVADSELFNGGDWIITSNLNIGTNNAALVITPDGFISDEDDDLTISDNLLVSGNLTVSGTLGTINGATICTDANGMCGSVSNGAGWTNSTTVVSLSDATDNVDMNILFINNTASGVGMGTATPVVRSGYSAPWLTISSNAPGITLVDANSGNQAAFISNSAGSIELGNMNDDGSSPTAYVTIGTTGAVKVGTGTAGNATGAGDLYITSDIEYDGNLYGPGADIAEILPSDELLLAGTVVSIKADKITQSTVRYDMRVAGVVTTNPGITLSKNTKGANIALAGRVPVRIDRTSMPITAGDRLVSAGNGNAMKLELHDLTQATSFTELKLWMEENQQRQQGIIGKALQDWTGEHTIEMLVLLH